MYFSDWTDAANEGARFENMVACHLLKAIDYWNDTGMGEFNLHFIRDKEKREVDFVVIKDNKPWMLIEVKSKANHSISKSLHYFAEKLNIKLSFQVAFDLPHVDTDCFTHKGPVIIPAKTFLSQLV